MDIDDQRCEIAKRILADFDSNEQTHYRTVGMGLGRPRINDEQQDLLRNRH